MLIKEGVIRLHLGAETIRDWLWAAGFPFGRHSDRLLGLLSKGEPFMGGDVIDWMDRTKLRADSRPLLADSRPLLADWPEMPVYPRPTASQKEVFGGYGVTAAGFVDYLLLLHRLGIDAGGRQAVEALRPTLRQREQLTHQELHVWWGAKEMDRMPPLIVETGCTDEVRGYPLPQVIEGASGYRLHVGRHWQTSEVQIVSVHRKERPGAVHDALNNAGTRLIFENAE